jgi:hypothetical protein
MNSALSPCKFNLTVAFQHRVALQSYRIVVSVFYATYATSFKIQNLIFNFIYPIFHNMFRPTLPSSGALKLFW